MRSACVDGGDVIVMGSKESKVKDEMKLMFCCGPCRAEVFAAVSIADTCSRSCSEMNNASSASAYDEAVQ